MFQYTKEILLRHGYAGFHFGLLAEKLNITREALYKYFKNKDDLITEFMVAEMEIFLTALQKINEFPTFTEGLDYLLSTISQYNKIHQILNLAFNIQNHTNERVGNNLKKLNQYHMAMYKKLNAFIQLGKDDHVLKQNIPNDIILGFIFHTVSIPNHQNISESEWLKAIKELICHGIYK